MSYTVLKLKPHFCRYKIIPPRFSSSPESYKYRLSLLCGSLINADILNAVDSYFQFFLPIDGYMSLSIIILGVILNMLNILVLTRKEMESAVHVLLTGLAFADFLGLCCYLPYSVHRINKEIFSEYIDSSGRLITIGTTSWCVFNTASIWLTVVVATWRYATICQSGSSDRWQSVFWARVAIISTYIASIAFNIPLYMQYTGWQKYFYKQVEDKIKNVYVVKYVSLLLGHLYTWVFGGMTKVVPAVLLAVLSILLVTELCKAISRRAKLSVRSNSNSRNDRITKMLIAVMILFLFSHLPYGLIFIINQVTDDYNSYILAAFLAGTSETLSLLNSAINFFVYYFMSTPFNEAFHRLFRVYCKKSNQSIQLETRSHEKRGKCISNTPV